MTRKKDRRNVTWGEFRRERYFLADHAFALPGGKHEPRDHKPRDLVGKKQWDQMMTVATDVVLRTTDHMGSMIEDMQNQWSAWMDATPLEPDQTRLRSSTTPTSMSLKSWTLHPLSGPSQMSVVVG
jgi:hypothetical protein